MIHPEAEFWLIVDHWIESGIDPAQGLDQAISNDLAAGLHIKELFDVYTALYPLWQFGSEYNEALKQLIWL